jgi:hypothetical protein
MATIEGPEMAKIGFKLEKDQDGYPSADWEWLWAMRISDSTFRIDSVPFFAKSISIGDVVAAETSNGALSYSGLVEPSGHSTVRVVVFRNAAKESGQELATVVADLRASLKSLGCSNELSHLANLFSVDIPPEVNYGLVSTFLSQKEADGVLEYEEACPA